MAFQYANVNSGGMSTHYHARSLSFLSFLEYVTTDRIREGGLFYGARNTYGRYLEKRVSFGYNAIWFVMHIY